MPQNESGKKLTTQNVISLIATIIGIIGSSFGAYMYIDEKYVSEEQHSHYKKMNQVRFIEMDLKETEHKLSHYLEIPEEELTTPQKNKIEVLTKKAAFLEENLPWD